MLSNLLYVGTYTQNDAPEVHGGKGIFTCRFDPERGAVEVLAVTKGIENPSFLTLSPDRRTLYAVSELTDADKKGGGWTVAYAIDPASGALTEINRLSSEGADPCHISVDSSGRIVMVANYTSGSVIAYPILEDGGLGERSSFFQHSGSGPNPRRQEGPHAHMIFPDPNSRYAYVPDLGMDRVMIYQIDSANAAIHSATAAFARVRSGEGPRHFDIHPNQHFAYVINELGSSLTAFSWDAQTGALNELQTISTLPEGFSGKSSCADVHVHPSGRFVYGSNRGHDSIAIYAIHPELGTLKAIDFAPTGGSCPRNFAIDPSGRFLLAANQVTNSIVSFAIDSESGRLTATGDSVTVPAPVCLKFV